MPYDVEVTDTFAGEANYCWVHRHVINPPAVDWSAPNGRRRDRRGIVRAAKAAEGWTGMRCDTEDSGDLITLRPRGLLQVMFINWRDDAAPNPEA